MPIETSTGPEASSGYGGREATDDTRQAQQSFSNDTPTDVNFNAIVGRSQSLTIDVLGKGFVAAQERRTIIADEMMRKP
jgi:hypothetical protein